MKSAEELERIYEKELKRRDALIDELRKQNDVLVKTAMKQSEKNVELAKQLEKFLREKD